MLPGIIGCIQVAAIKLITGIGEPLIGRLLMYDALDMKYRTSGCDGPRMRRVRQESHDYRADRLRAILRRGVRGGRRGRPGLDDQRQGPDPPWLDAGDNIFLVDVREPNEYEIVSIPGATLIPKGEFVSGAALEKLPQDKRIVLHCKSGARSAEALAIVKNAGFTDAVHVGGGVLAWVGQVDPALPSIIPNGPGFSPRPRSFAPAGRSP